MKIVVSKLKICEFFKFDLNDSFECFVKYKTDSSVYFGVTPNRYRPHGGCCSSDYIVHIKPYGYNQLTLFNT